MTPPAPLPFDAAAFDLVILHNIDGHLAPLGAGTRTAAVRECYRVLRTGGRIMAIEAGAPSGLRAVLRQSQPSQGHETTGDIAVALEAAGFRPVRVLADREGYRFTEGIKR